MDLEWQGAVCLNDLWYSQEQAAGESVQDGNSLASLERFFVTCFLHGDKIDLFRCHDHIISSDNRPYKRGVV